ncbi:hypothetical protein GCM10008025_36230 [Ornithinibacillus halotolerans]|uniref:Uncharacterized protein n=1 Tax=Ornithinibacillus halotolerans TaxID=1274357 RepID=A0A916S9V1_9BACI|nr:hypothetical protein GCM10008025_36230 [Ornithinibacillus halotolerans]
MELIGISDIIIFMLVYGVIFLYTMCVISSKNKILLYIKSALLIFFYVSISSMVWIYYKTEEDYFNSHSGLGPISYTDEAVLLLVGFCIYNIILFLLSVQLNRKWPSVNS